jgi:hypothetical protein
MANPQANEFASFERKPDFIRRSCLLDSVRFTTPHKAAVNAPTPNAPRGSETPDTREASGLRVSLAPLSGRMTNPQADASTSCQPKQGCLRSALFHLHPPSLTTPHKAAVNAPQSKRSAQFANVRQSRSVWTACVFSTAFPQTTKTLSSFPNARRPAFSNP